MKSGAGSTAKARVDSADERCARRSARRSDRI